MKPVPRCSRCGAGRSRRSASGRRSRACRRADDGRAAAACPASRPRRTPSTAPASQQADRVQVNPAGEDAVVHHGFRRDPLDSKYAASIRSAATLVRWQGPSSVRLEVQRFGLGEGDAGRPVRPWSIHARSNPTCSADPLLPLLGHRAVRVGPGHERDDVALAALPEYRRWARVAALEERIARLEAEAPPCPCPSRGTGCSSPRTAADLLREIDVPARLARATTGPAAAAHPAASTRADQPTRASVKRAVERDSFR